MATSAARSTATPTQPWEQQVRQPAPVTVVPITAGPAALELPRRASSRCRLSLTTPSSLPPDPQSCGGGGYPYLPARRGESCTRWCWRRRRRAPPPPSSPALSSPRSWVRASACLPPPRDSSSAQAAPTPTMARTGAAAAASRSSIAASAPRRHDSWPFAAAAGGDAVGLRREKAESEEEGTRRGWHGGPTCQWPTLFLCADDKWVPHHVFNSNAT